MQQNAHAPRKKRRINALVLITGALCVALFCATIFYAMFSSLAKSYTSNITIESAQHMSEISMQLSSTIKTVLDGRLHSLQTMAVALNMMPDDSMETALTTLATLKELWGANEIYLYNETGACVNQDGEHAFIPEALNKILAARREGCVFSVAKSDVEYLLPVYGTAKLAGSPIAAISIQFSLEKCLEDENIMAFDRTGRLYLTQENGVIISRLVPEGDPSAYNIHNLLNDAFYADIDASAATLAEAMASGEPSRATLTLENDVSYLTITPIAIQNNHWCLFYLVPASVFNAQTNTFTASITRLSFEIMLSFSMLGCILFFVIYRRRSRQMDAAMRARDRMLDLLVTKTANAFSILRANGAMPGYVSPNAHDFIGDNALHLYLQKSGYVLLLEGGEVVPYAEALNEGLAQWDGAAEFVSSYLQYNNSNGETRYAVFRLCPPQTEGGEYVCIWQDATADRAREDALRQALNDANQANVAKTRFLANMSHDIRTPMNAIIGMTRFAMEEPERTPEYLRIIDESAKHLLSLINDILDMSRIESGQMDLSIAPFSIREVARKAAEMVSTLSENKRQRFESRVCVTHDMAEGDLLRINQILINLLNNAVKFTPEGGTISLDVEEYDVFKSDYAGYRIAVRDNGIGMDAATIADIFKPFVRADDHRVQRVEGTGLGLAITKSLLDTMGGSILVESRLGEGSTFTISIALPISAARTTSATGTRVEARRFDGRCVLLAEDDRINQRVAQKTLERFGVRCDIVNNGREAVERFESAAPGTYDAILMDIQMPVMNGYEAAMAIRVLGTPGAARIPITALSANVFAEDMEKSRRAGMNAHLGKPIDPDEIADVLAGFWKQRRAANG